MLELIAVGDTWLKLRPVQAKELSEKERIRIGKGQKIRGKLLGKTSDGHSLIELEAVQRGYFNWWIFPEHCIKSNTNYINQTAYFINAYPDPAYFLEEDLEFTGYKTFLVFVSASLDNNWFPIDNSFTPPNEVFLPLPPHQLCLEGYTTGIIAFRSDEPLNCDVEYEITNDNGDSFIGTSSIAGNILVIYENLPGGLQYLFRFIFIYDDYYTNNMFGAGVNPARIPITLGIFLPSITG